MWIESHQGLARQFGRALDVSLPQAVGHLHLLWWWALDCACDGSLAKFGAQDIARAAEWTGDPDLFVTALTDCGKIERDAVGRLRLCGWDDYAGAPRRTATPWVSRSELAATPAPMPAASDSVTLQPTSVDKPSAVPHARRGARRTSGDATNTLSPTADKPSREEVEDWAIAADFGGRNLGTAGVLRPTELDKLRDWHKRGLNSGCLIRAMQEAIDHGAPNWAYIGAICERWIGAGVRQVEDIVPLEHDREFRKGRDKRALRLNTPADPEAVAELSRLIGKAVK